MGLVSIEMAISRVIETNPYKIVVSNPVKKSECKYKRIEIVLKTIKNSPCYQIARYTDTQVFHENVGLPEINSSLISVIGEYRQLNSFSESFEIEVKINRNMEAVLKKNAISNVSHMKAPSENNRKKNYILEEGMDIPAFVELGIFTKEGKIVNSRYDKYKQINRFTELVEDALKNYHRNSINIIDFGCGKSYLTFVLYFYLTKIRKMKVRILGLDLKADVIKKCNEIAKRYDYDDLVFEVGDINGYSPNFDVDMVVTLHACDTATDYALFNAIQWNSSIILSVPCCQHEVNREIKSNDLSAITKYGIIKERISALMTDSVRGCMLEYCGYRTEVIEFVDLEHSPKNLLIRAVKANISDNKRKAALEEAKKLADSFGFEQTLMKKVLQDNNGD